MTKFFGYLLFEDSHPFAFNKMNDYHVICFKKNTGVIGIALREEGRKEERKECFENQHS
jgi:hypothetical protein